MLKKRQQQALATKEKIRQTAIELFRQHGFVGVTIEMICRKAGVSKGLFYNYFPSKEDLMLNEFKSVDVQYQRLVEEQFYPGQPTIDRLKLLLRAALAVSVDTQFDHTAAKVAYVTMVKLRKNYITSPNRQLARIISDIIIYGKERGELRSDIPDDLIRESFYIFIAGSTFLSFAEEDRQAYKEKAFATLDIMVSGYLKQKGKE